MAEKKLDVNKPASLYHSGPITYFQPTAEPKLNEKGEVVSGAVALEQQKKEMQRVEKAAQQEANPKPGELSKSEKADLMQAASQKAAEEGTSAKEQYDKLKQHVKEDKKLTEEVKGKAPAPPPAKVEEKK